LIAEIAGGWVGTQKPSNMLRPKATSVKRESKEKENILVSAENLDFPKRGGYLLPNN